jgi:hypothetical protein
MQYFSPFLAAVLASLTVGLLSPSQNAPVRQKRADGLKARAKEALESLEDQLSLSRALGLSPSRLLRQRAEVQDVFALVLHDQLDEAEQALSHALDLGTDDDSPRALPPEVFY